MHDAFLDIETTGLSFYKNIITIIGIFITDNHNEKFVQLISPNITKQNLIQSLQNTNTIYTFNGNRFDIPFIHAKLGINLSCLFATHDLFLHCKKYKLTGSLKAIEQQLNINRNLKDITGATAVTLWNQYHHNNNLQSLQTLLAYNKEDTTNLKILKEKLINI